MNSAARGETDLMKTGLVLLPIVLILSACASVQAEPEDTSSPLVRAADVVPDLREDMRYFGSENFIGRPINGYNAPVCLLTEPAADALAKVAEDLAVTGLGLKVFDCYRPARAVADFVEWARDLDDLKMKAVYYPDVPKSLLFERGYIAERSGHSRASTVDLTIVDLETGEELDMGSWYDLFDPLSWPTDLRHTADQRANRALLRSVMIANGFRPLAEEWWHFTLNDEPFPETYFDIPVE